MPVGKILWGSASSGVTYENELVLGYVLYEFVDDRVPRAAYETVQSPAGIEDAWIPGFDYQVMCEARWIPDTPAGSPTRTPVNGPNNWSQFMDYARAKNVFRFVPAATNPNFFIDNVYLVEPTSSFGRLDDTKLFRNVALVLRNPSVPWTQAAVRMVAAEWAPGQPSTLAGFDWTFAAAAGSRSYLGKDGILRYAPANVPRDRGHADGVAASMLTIEPFQRNVSQWSEASTNWASSGAAAAITTGFDTAPDGALTAALITASSIGSALLPPTTFLSGSTFATVACHFKAGSSGSQQRLMIVTSSGATQGYGTISWTTDITPVPSIVASSAGVLVGFTSGFANGWWRAYAAMSVSTAGFSYQAKFMPDVATSAGSVEVWGLSLEPRKYPATYIPTTAAAQASNSSDQMYFNLPAGFQTPQALWAYFKFVERGTVSFSTGALPIIWEIGSSATANASLRLFAGGANTYAAQLRSSAGATKQATMAVAPNFGDTVEILLTVSSSGVLTMYQSINGGADASTNATALGALPSTWGDTRIIMGLTQAMPTDWLALKMGPGAGFTSIQQARSA